MSAKNLDKIFKPSSIAIIGASDKEGSVGHTIMKNVMLGRSKRDVVPVNPNRDSVQGLKAFATIGDVPQDIDLAIICTPAKTVATIVEQCGNADVQGIIIISAGFRELGEKGRKLEEQIRDTQRNFDKMRIIGPNCLGIIVPELDLNASFAGSTPQPGRLAFISQSGALCTSVLDWSQTENVGFSNFISIGNMIDVNFADLIDYFRDDEKTRAALLYIETIQNGPYFVNACRDFSHEKPIIAYKAGRYKESAGAAASHTGAMAGEDAVFDAAFERAGIVRVNEIDDLFETAEILASQQVPNGKKLAIVTNAGGPGVMATDALIERGGELAPLSEKLMKNLDDILPPFWSRANPIDILGDATPERYGKAVEKVLADKDIDAALVILTPQAMTDPSGSAQAIADLDAKKAILAAWMGGKSVSNGMDILNEKSIATFEMPERALDAFMYLCMYAKNLKIVREDLEEKAIRKKINHHAQRQKFKEMFEDRSRTFSEVESKAMLKAYGIPIAQTEMAASAEEAVEIANKMGYPVVLKIFSADISHKTDVDGVKLNLQDDQQVHDAFNEIISNAEIRRPDAKVEGVTIQPMIDGNGAHEIILGAKKDPVFGPVILVGLGGIAAEVFNDRTLSLLPITEKSAHRMLQELKSWQILSGYRGKKGINVERLIEIMIRFSYLIADFPEIKEMDINPLFVNAKDAIALDARLILEENNYEF